MSIQSYIQLFFVYTGESNIDKCVSQLGHFCSSEKLGKGAAEASQPQHSDCSGWKQSRHREQESCGASGIKYKPILHLEENYLRYLKPYSEVITTLNLFVK